MDATLWLPPELVEEILKYLDIRELGILSQVSISWREAINKDSIWLHHCMKLGWFRFCFNKDILEDHYLSVGESNISKSSPVFNLYIPENSRLTPLCKWKNIFVRVKHLHENWKKGRYYVVPGLKGHTDKLTALDSNGSVAVTGGSDKLLIVWDLKTYTKSKEIHIHTDTINQVIVRGNVAITCCADSAIRLIDIDSGQLLFSLLGHAGNVDHMVVIGNNTLVSSASDKTVRVWSLPEKKLKYTMRDGHSDEVECMSSFGSHVISGSWDKSMVLWDIEHGKKVHKFVGHAEVVSCVQFDDYKIVSGSGDHNLRIWNIQSRECEYILEGHTGEIYCLTFNPEVIASGAQDSTVRLWSHTGEALHVLTGHLGVVRCLSINDQRLVSGGDQKKVMIWDYRKGKLLNMAHRNPSKLHLMWVNDTKIILGSPEHPGTMTVLSYW